MATGRAYIDSEQRRSNLGERGMPVPNEEQRESDVATGGLVQLGRLELREGLCEAREPDGWTRARQTASV